jgi:hypothetical protein
MHRRVARQASGLALAEVEFAVVLVKGKYARGRAVELPRPKAGGLARNQKQSSHFLAGLHEVGDDLPGVVRKGNCLKCLRLRINKRWELAQAGQDYLSESG